MSVDRTKKSDEELQKEFFKYALDVAKGGDPYVVYLKSNSLRSICIEMHRQGITPAWEKAQQAAHNARWPGWNQIEANQAAKEN